jgi:hypothetical protein
MDQNKVPKEVLWYLFSYAGPSSFGIFRLVCKRWKQIIDSNNFQNFSFVSKKCFSSCTFSLFDTNFFRDNLNQQCVANFDSFEYYKDGYISDMYTVHLENEGDYERAMKKIVHTCSFHGNKDNWKMSKIPNSIQASIQTIELDNFFRLPLFSNETHIPSSKIVENTKSAQEEFWQINDMINKHNERRSQKLIKIPTFCHMKSSL